MIRQTVTSKIYEPRSKKQFCFIDILYRIHQGQTPYDIRKAYGWSRQRTGYYISALEKANFIAQVSRSSIAVYELTLEGKNWYSGYVNSVQGVINLHNVAWTYSLQNIGSIKPMKTWHANGTCFNELKLNDVTVVWTSKSLTIMISALQGTDAFALFEKAKVKAEQIADQLRTNGFNMSAGRLSRQPHFAVINPVAEQITKHLQFSNDQAKLDRSEGAGELEYFTPEAVDAYVKMPMRMATLEQHIVKQDEILQGFSRNIELHLKVLQDIGQAVNELKETLKAKA